MISELAVKSDSFIPLLPAVATAAPLKEPAFSPLNIKVLVQPATKSIFEALRAAPEQKTHAPEICAKPTVTLQRNGEIVTGIHIQCGCGQVIELNCIY